MGNGVGDVTDDTFEEKVLQSGKPVLVDFWATWCGPCKMVAPILDEIAEEQSERFSIVRMDVDANPGTATTYGIRSIPTMMLFKGGHRIGSIIGAQPKDALLGRLDEYLT